MPVNATLLQQAEALIHEQVVNSIMQDTPKQSVVMQLGRRLTNMTSNVVWGSNGNLPVNRDAPCLPGVYSYVNVPSAKRHHQTEKPVELMEDLLQIVPGRAVVLDPFMGSGSTGVACAHMERDFIGIELNRQYYDTAKSRIEQARVERKTQLLN
ncbi:MAG: DNA methyltransferase [Clostridia bacterium]